MFGKKEKPRRQNRPPGGLAQFGIFEVPESLDGPDLTEDNDADLEAELAALTGEDAPRRPKRGKKPIPDAQLNAMVAESMRDIDEEVSDGEDDPELLSELKMITGDESAEESSPVEDAPAQDSDPGSTDATVRLLQERLSMYETAERKAKERNEGAKARRYNRGLKTLQELLRTAQAGREVNEADIPPQLPPSAISDPTDKPEGDSAPVLDNAAAESTEESGGQSVEVTAESKTQNEEALGLLKARQQEYKMAALSWKKAGNMKEALTHLNIVKQFDKVIEAVNAGEAVDLSDMPPSPSTPSSAAATSGGPAADKQENEVQQNSSAQIPPTEDIQHAGPEDLGTALKERLEVYRKTKTAAETEGNSSKARRYGRICKQFEDALKLHARGKPVPVDELPTPPGYPPLSATPPAAAGAAAAPAAAVGADTDQPRAEESPGPALPSRPKPPTPPSRAAPAVPGAKKPNQRMTSRAEKQLALLQKRQHELKQAALNAKETGDVDLARDYLRQAKGIQPLIEASKSGLPVDLTSIPLSPLARVELDSHGLTGSGGQTDDSFTLVSSEDCDLEIVNGTDEQIYENLESQLVKQVKWCLATRDHSKALGDVPGYNRWERLALNYTRDLDMLRIRKRDGLPPPLHHYETKTYAIVQSCVDLNDCDIEISIIRGINYPKEADTYVIYEFPYPSESPPTDRTATIRGTNNPEYQAVFNLTVIDRGSRQCQRAFKRHAIKCQVWSKGCSLNPILCCTHPRGFFRNDSLLGTVTVKLQPLETQCVLHDSFPLMDGRKRVGGQLELKIRLRNPIATKQIEQSTDKWLTIDR